MILNENCNNSNRSFNLSLKQRKLLWFHTLDYANSQHHHKTTSLNSNNDGSRRQSINDVDKAFKNYLNKRSIKKKKYAVRRSVTFSNVNISNISECKYPMYGSQLLNESYTIKDYDAKEYKNSFDDSKQQRRNLHSPATYVMNSQETVINKNYEENSKVQTNDIRFLGFFDYLEKIDVNDGIKKDEQCDDGKSSHLAVETSHDEKNSLIPNIVSVLPSVQGQQQLDLKRKDLTYDDRYLYSSFKEDLSTKLEKVKTGKVNNYLTLFPKEKYDSIKEPSQPIEHSKKPLKSLTIHKLMTDVKNKIPFSTKKSSRKIKSKSIKNLKYSEVKDFEDEFFNNTKLIAKDKKKLYEAAINRMISERVDGIEGMDINQSIDLDENETMEIVERIGATEFEIEKADSKEKVDMISSTKLNGNSENIKETYRSSIVSAKDIKTKEVVHPLEQEKIEVKSEINSAISKINPTGISLTDDRQIEIITMRIFEDLVKENKTDVSRAMKSPQRYEKQIVRENESPNLSQIVNSESTRTRILNETMAPLVKESKDKDGPDLMMKKDVSVVNDEKAEYGKKISKHPVTEMETDYALCGKIEKEFNCEGMNAENIENQKCVLDNYEVIEAVSQRSPSKETSSDQISYYIPIADHHQFDNLDISSDKSKEISDIIELFPGHKQQYPAHIDVFLEDATLTKEPIVSIYQSNVESKFPPQYPDHIANLSLLSTKRLRKSCVKKTTIQSSYHGKKLDRFPVTGDSITTNNIRPLSANQNIYRCNEMLLHSNKFMRPQSTPRNAKNHYTSNILLNKKTTKSSFWCLPYKNNQSKEKTSVTFSYKSRCADCRGKSFQTFQLVPQSPQHDCVHTSDTSTKTLQTQPYIFFDKEYKGPNDKVKTEQQMDEPYLKRASDREETNRKINIESNQLKREQHRVFEVQSPSDKSNKENDNASVYLELDKKNKIETLNADSKQKNTQISEQDNQIVFIFEKTSQGETDNFLKLEEGAKVDHTEPLKTTSKYEAMVFNANTRLSNPSETNILNSNKYYLPSTTKESLTLTREGSNIDEQTKSTKLDLEYNDTIDMDDVALDTYSLYPPSLINVIESNNLQPRITDSEFENYFNRTRMNDPEFLDMFNDRFQPEPDIVNLNNYCLPTLAKEDITIASGNSSEGGQPHLDRGFNNSVDLTQHDNTVEESHTYSKPTSNKDVKTAEDVGSNAENMKDHSDVIKGSEERSETVSSHKVPDVLDTSTDANTDHQILKESSRALKLKQRGSVDPDDLLISSYEPPTVKEDGGPEHIQRLVKDEINSESTNSDKSLENLSHKCNRSPILVKSILESNSDEITCITDIQNRKLIERQPFPFESCKTSSNQNDTTWGTADRQFEQINKDVLNYLLSKLIDILSKRCNARLKAHVGRGEDNTSSDDCSPIDDSWRPSNNLSINISTTLCCYFCQCQIPRLSYDEHIKLCTETQKNLIVQTKLQPGTMGKNLKDKPLSSMPATICFVCGCYFTKHSILIHEVACRKKWIKRNEHLPKSQRKPIPEKPIISDEMIRENYEQEQHRGNNKFKLKDAINKLIYEASLKNNFDLEI